MPTSILVVDDDQSVLEVMKVMLKLTVHRVDTVDNGEIALEMCQARDYDIVLSDLIMPKMSGIELIQAVKKLHKTYQPIIILMTGSHFSEDKIGLQNKGAFDVLSKPIGIRRLQDSMALAIEHQAKKKSYFIEQVNPVPEKISIAPHDRYQNK